MTARSARAPLSRSDGFCISISSVTDFQLPALKTARQRPPIRSLIADLLGGALDLRRGIALQRRVNFLAGQICLALFLVNAGQGKVKGGIFRGGFGESFKGSDCFIT